MIRILFISDIVGEPGRRMIAKKLSMLLREQQPDFIIANAENAAGGKGVTPAIAKELLAAGIDVITLGNHTFDRKEVMKILDEPRILRPANYPQAVAGNGWGTYPAKNGTPVAVINLMGRVYLPLTDDPFLRAHEIVNSLSNEVTIRFVDFHAEVTSEKVTMGWHLDGKVTAVIGTHTHVPTADERILPHGTAYLSDAGMTGPRDGVIGMDRDTVIAKYLTAMPKHFVIAPGSALLQGCVVDADEKTGRAISISRVTVHE